MKRLEAILEGIQILEFLYIVYGVCGAYEQELTTGTQFIARLLTACTILAVTTGILKVLEAVRKNKKNHFLKSKQPLKTKDLTTIL